MKPILVIGDVHGEFDTLFRVLDASGVENCTLICVGDLGIGFIDSKKQLKQINMREIKFRVWDNQNNDWLIKQRIEDHPVELLYSDHKFYISHSLDNLDDYTIQQYTGLLDKNGVEIYEGDILEIVGGLAPLVNCKKSAKYVVEYAAPSFTYKIINGEHMRGCGYTNPPIPEIIGNIFENSELLK